MKYFCFILIFTIIALVLVRNINNLKITPYYYENTHHVHPNLYNVLSVRYCGNSMILLLNSKTLINTDFKQKFLVMYAINKLTKKITFERVFNIAVWSEHEEELVKILKSFPPNRIVVIVSAKKQINHFSENLRERLKSMGSKLTRNHTPNKWAFVYDVDSESVIEEKNNFGPLKFSLRGCIEIEHRFNYTNSIAPLDPTIHCSSWPNTPSYRRRTEFCIKYDSYNEYCDCEKHLPIDFSYRPLGAKVNRSDDEILINTPIVIMASKRPFYLILCLQSLLPIRGLYPNNVHVYIDGHYNATVDVAILFNVKFTTHVNICTGTCAVKNHYRESFEMAFGAYSKASEIIILEEDLEVAPDFMLFMAETIPFLRRDPSLYCVSAWNDQSYLYTLGDPSGLFKTDFMPGLGWALLRSIYEQDLKPAWSKDVLGYDWDYWVRDNRRRKNRDCVVPDISRTFHAGLRGNTMYPYLFRNHFAPRPKFPYYVQHFNTSWLEHEAYHNFLTSIIKAGKVANNYNSIIEDFDKSYSNYQNGVMYANLNQLPTGYSYNELVDRTTVLFINTEKSINYNWNQLTTRFKLWKLDVRDFFHGTIRIWFNNHHYVLVMYPKSKYSSLKPEDLSPIPLI